MSFSLLYLGFTLVGHSMKLNSYDQSDRLMHRRALWECT